jgi:hypothetical protein
VEYVKREIEFDNDKQVPDEVLDEVIKLIVRLGNREWKNMSCEEGPSAPQGKMS